MKETYHSIPKDTTQANADTIMLDKLQYGSNQQSDLDRSKSSVQYINCATAIPH